MAISLEAAAAAVATKRPVRYGEERGVIIGTSRSSTYVFVRYDGEYGAKATRLEDLAFDD